MYLASSCFTQRVVSNVVLIRKTLLQHKILFYSLAQQQWKSLSFFWHIHAYRILSKESNSSIWKFHIVLFSFTYNPTISCSLLSWGLSNMYISFITDCRVSPL